MMQRPLSKNGLPRDIIFLFFAVSVTLLGDSSLYVLLPIHAESLNIPVGMVGLLLSANRFIRLFTNYFVLKCHLRLGSLVMLIGSVIGAALTTLLYGLTAGLAVLLVSRMLWGLCWSVLRYESYDSIAQETAAAMRGYASGLYHSITRVGSLAALLISGVIIEWAGYRNTFLVFSIATLVIGLVLVFLWHDTRRKRWHKKDEPEKTACERPCQALQLPDSQPADPGTAKAGLRRRLLSPWHCYAFTFFSGWIGSGLLVTTVGYIMMLKFGHQIKLAGIVIGISMAASFITSTNWFYSIFLSVLTGRLSDRFGRIRVLVVICLVLVGALASLAYVDVFLLFILAATIGFAASISLHAVLTALTIDLHCHIKRGAVIANQTTSSDLGAAMGALLGLTLITVIGYTWTYLLSLMVLGVLLLSLCLPGQQAEL